MKTKNLLLVSSILACSFASTAQIIAPSNPDYGIGGVVFNTGLAIAPNYPLQSIQAAVNDDGFGNYNLRWIDPSGTAVDNYSGSGDDPDVAYYANPDALAVGYENGGDIYVDAFYLNTVTPVDYNFSSTNYIAAGTHANIDMNSSGRGALCWQDGNDIWACTFDVGGFTSSPPVLIYSGAGQPDIVWLDSGKEIVLTYVLNSGELEIHSVDPWDLSAGGLTTHYSYTMPFYGSAHKSPRIAADRNALFGSLDNYTVVSQDWNGSGFYVIGYFVNSGSLNPPVLLNQGLQNCSTGRPMPVVAYERSKVNVAWGQYYSTTCSSGYGSGDNILQGEFDFAGNNMNGVGVYLQVNTTISSFNESSTSISGEYDGNYSVNNFNYHEGIVFNDPGDMLWKMRDNSTNYKMAGTEAISFEEVSFELAGNPVSQTIDVIVRGEGPVVFELYDNMGRLIPMSNTVVAGDHYVMDAMNLSSGIYLLKCTSGNTTKILRVLHD